MQTITVYLAESERKRRRRSKWLIPLCVGLIAAFAFGRQKAPVKTPSLPIVAPVDTVGTVVEPMDTVATTTTVTIEQPAEVDPAPIDPTPAPPAHVVVTPARLDFGDGPMNRGVAAQLSTVRNDGGQPITRVTTSVNSPFIATNGCTNGIAPGAECMVAVTFAPQKPGKFTGALTIVTDTGRNRVLLSGNVTRPREPRPTTPVPTPIPTPVDEPAPPPVVVPARPLTPKRNLCADPPRLRFTQTGKQSITLKNPENTPIRVMGVAILGQTGLNASGYEIDSGKCTRVLNPGQRCKFTVRATELAIQRSETITLNVYYDDLTTGERRAAGVINCGSR